MGEAVPKSDGDSLASESAGTLAVAGPTPPVTNDAEHLRLPTGLPADIAVSDAPVVVMRADGSILYASEAYCRLVGTHRATSCSACRADRADIASSAERTRWIIDRASEVGTAFKYRRLYATPSGDRLVDVSVHRVADDLVVTTMAHVTDEDDVQSDTEVLGSFLDAVPLGVVVYDRALRIVRVNRTVEELGRVRPEHLGRRVTEAFPDVDPAVVAAIEDVLASGEQIVNLALARPDGHSLLLNFFPIRDAHGAVAQVGCLFSDVTEFVEAHETIEAQEEAIRELATPILELEDGILVAPLVGAMDADRARDLTERLLHAIPRARARRRRLRRDRRPGHRCGRLTRAPERSRGGPA